MTLQNVNAAGKLTARLRANLIHAQAAVHEVRIERRMVASNRWYHDPNDFIGVPSRGLSCVTDMRAKVGGGNIDHDRIRRSAEEATKAKCGNCGELAAMAIVWLENKGLTLDLVEVDPFGLKNNHAFVLIDRAPSPNWSDYSTWGPTAVICDPWDRQAYSVAEFPGRMNGWLRDSRIKGMLRW